MEPVSGVAFLRQVSTQTKAVFSSFSRPENAFLIESELSNASGAHVRCYLPTRGIYSAETMAVTSFPWELFGNRWGKFPPATHHHSFATFISPKHTLCTVTQFRSRRPSFDLASRCRGCWRRTNSRFPAKITSRGKSTIARKTMHASMYRSVMRYRKSSNSMLWEKEKWLQL